MFLARAVKRAEVPFVAGGFDGSDERAAELFDDPSLRLCAALVEDLPNGFLYNPTVTFIVNRAVTGYTPSPSEFEWPGSAGSVMTLDITE